VASQQTSGAAALRYATALVEIAADSKNIDSVEQDLNDLEAMMAGSEDLQNLIKSPLMSRQQQHNAIVAVAEKAKFQVITANFLCLLAQNRRLNMLSSIINAVRMEFSKMRGEVSAHVASAFKLSPEQEKALQESLTKAMGQTVAVKVDVQEDLIGGMVVTVGSQIIDDSVKRKLERLKIAMKSNANNNADDMKVANEN
jgi:F-type H+-transporting ATPase subunit delta